MTRNSRLVAHRRWSVAPTMSVAAALVSAFALLPLAFVLWATVQAGWETVVRLVFRDRVGQLLANTALLLMLVIPVCAALAVGLAWLTERTDLPGRRSWAWLMVAPLAVPAFVHGYAWVSAVPSLHGIAGGALVAVAAYFPFVYLPVASAMRRLDPAWEEAAASLGLSPLRVFGRVVLPQLRLALLGGALLIGLHLLAEYGLFAMLRFDTFTTAIVDQFQSTFNGPAANMLAAVLVACSLGLLCLESAVRGRLRYARLGGGAPRPRRPHRLGWTAVPCLLLMLGVAAASLGVPGVSLVRWLVAGGLRVWRWDEIGPALGETVWLATVGAVLTVVAAFPVSWLATRVPGRLQRTLEGMNLIAGALPGVVLALAIVTVAVRVRPIYQTAFTILLAYAIMFLPHALVGLRASLAQVPPELEKAALVLGRSPARMLWSVTVRLASPGVAAAMALVSLAIATELTATQMLAPNGTQTLATAFWSFSGEIDYAAAAPYAVLMVLISSPLTWLLHHQSKRASGR